MLSPRQSSTREHTSLDGLWRFALDPRGAGRAERWWTRALPGDGEMAVPASSTTSRAREGARQVGDVWSTQRRVPRAGTGSVSSALTRHAPGYAVGRDAQVVEPRAATAVRGDVTSTSARVLNARTSWSPTAVV